jgi:4-hydroxythreonine-4-phosphate dehydrogenase
LSLDQGGFSVHDDRPLVALTMGDVAGIGPEVIARAWGESPLRTLARPFVVGRCEIMARALSCVGGQSRVVPIERPEDADPSAHNIPCLDASKESLGDIAPGTIDGRAGRAARDFLITAIELALEGRIDALTTLPLNKESLRLGGIAHPGHTEILAERCGVSDFSMMLYIGPPVGAGDSGLGVVHATLHVPLRQVFSLLTVPRVFRTIALADLAMRPLTGGRPPRVAVAGLNPHAGEHGLFGDEEQQILLPAIARARADGIDVNGPVAADTLFVRAIAGEFDAVVAMYHDQGHVAIKTIGFNHAVNVTLGLPIVRTSVAHGTAFDIAWQGRAETSSLVESVRVAARIVAGRRALGQSLRPSNHSS